jgi:glycosyltransferase involved in cell wall biosynthesis
VSSGSSGQPAYYGQAIQRLAFKPRVALLVDTHDWAFGNIARQIVRYLSGQFDFVTIPVEWVGSMQRALSLCEQADLIHVFWREYLSRFEWPEFNRETEIVYGSMDQFQSTVIGRRALTTSIYDHLFLAPEQLAERARLFRKLVSGYTVSSNRLRGIYYSQPGFPAPDATTPDGVDLGIFSPVQASPSRNDLIVGWVGNSRWSSSLYEDHKGLHTILIPAIEQLKAQGIPVQLRLADRADGLRPQADMPDFYRGLDVYVCASLHEGTPNPVLEAMGCGIPVISTDVGIVPEVFGPKQHSFILPERSPGALAASLRRLHADRTLLTTLRQENLESIQSWDWSLRARPFSSFFNQILRRTRR